MNIKSFLELSRVKFFLFLFLCSIFLLIIPIPFNEAYIRGIPLMWFEGTVIGVDMHITITKINWIGLVADFAFWYLISCLVVHFLKPRVAGKTLAVLKILSGLVIIVALVNAIYISLMVAGFMNTSKESPRVSLRSYFDQMRTAAAVWRVNQTPTTYIGFNTSGDGLTLENKIKEISGANYYNTIVSTDAFCAKAKYVGLDKNSRDYYWCIDSDNGYSGPVTSTDSCTGSNPDCL